MTMADTNRTRLVSFRRFFRPYPLFKRALMAAKHSPPPYTEQDEGSVFIIRLKLKHITEWRCHAHKNCGGDAERKKVHHRRRNRGSVLGTAAEVGCQHINELRICRRL